MAKTIFLFYTICRNPSRDKELSDWYDKIHIPDVEAVPGFTSCIRYKLTDRRSFDVTYPQDIKATYLSIVEADLDVETARARLAEGVAKMRERGLMSDLYEVVSSKIIAEVNPSHNKGQAARAAQA